MDKTEAFKQSVRNLKFNDNQGYVSDPSNWCVVHTTKYMPLEHKDGTKYIPSTAMATNYESPRTTVHATFNHVVRSHMMGNWDNMPIVVLAPYNEVVKENGKPVQIATTDTYWSVNPTRGFVLPKNAYIIKPSNDVLFNISENGATYKRDNYTEEEIQTILGLLDPEDREKYEKYEKGEFKDYEIASEFYMDSRVKKMYESSKDKRAFLRGLFEESRFDILTHYLRDVVVNMAMEKLGFEEINVYDGDILSEKVAETAIGMGIDATASNKGHSNSFYAEMENFCGRISGVFNGGLFDEHGIINAPDLESLFNYIVSSRQQEFIRVFIQSIIKNKPVDFKELYENYFIGLIENRIYYVKSGIEYLNQELSYIPTYQISDQEKEQRKSELLRILDKRREYINKMSDIKKISDYDKNLAYVFQKNAEYLSSKYEPWLANLSKQPGYNEFIKKLKNKYSVENTNIVTMLRERD